MNNLNLIETIVDVGMDPTTTKIDILKTLKDIIDNNEEVYNAFGKTTIADDDINFIEYTSLDSDDIINNASYVKDGDKIEVHNVEKSKKMVSLYVKEASKEEARYFTDLYHQFQKFRIAIQNQIRSIDQGVDQSDATHKKNTNTKEIDTPLTNAFRHHLLKQVETIEKDIAGCLADYSDRMPMGRYAKAITGIGPVFATALCSYLDIPDKETLPPDRQSYTCGNWVSYCGLNDNNRPWIKSDKVAREMVEEAIQSTGGIINEDTVRILCSKSKWSYQHYYKFCCDRKTGKFEGFTKEKLVKGTKLIPYNATLKKTMFLIGQSFIKVSRNDKSLYGRLYRERLQYEIDRNESGGNAEAAARYLKEKNWGKGTVSYKAYIQGKLPKSQLTLRAQRHTCKILLSHLFEFAYMEKYHEQAPEPYVFAYSEELGQVHKDYIAPEVPIEDYLS